MYHIVSSRKDFDRAAADLESAVTRHGFGVLHVHDLSGTLRSKGIAFDGQCKIFEVCNPGQAARVLSTDLRLNMALPCRISVYTDHGETKLGFVKPVQMLATLSDDPTLVGIAKEVEVAVTEMVEEAK